MNRIFIAWSIVLMISENESLGSTMLLKSLYDGAHICAELAIHSILKYQFEPRRDFMDNIDSMNNRDYLKKKICSLAMRSFASFIIAQSFAPRDMESPNVELVPNSNPYRLRLLMLAAAYLYCASITYRRNPSSIYLNERRQIPEWFVLSVGVLGVICSLRLVRALGYHQTAEIMQCVGWAV